MAAKESRRSAGQKLNDFVNRSIDWLSNTLSKYRGLPMMAAVGLILVNLLVVVLNDLAQGAAPALAFLASTNCFLHLGLLLGFAGILLSVPLGRG
mgnify:CR=1 FL=1